MLTVVLNVHPLSKRVIEAHYGASPIFLNNHDPLFDLLTGSRARQTCGPVRERFTEDILISVRDDIARHINANAQLIADRLFRHHKDMMCWYVAGIVHARGNAKAAIRDWMDLHGISEDDYAAESFYKVWQRFGWEFGRKNTDFSNQMRTKKAGILITKKKRFAKRIRAIDPPQHYQQDIEVELAIARFLAAYENTFRRVPVKIPKHARIYIYRTLQGLTEREVATKCGVKQPGAHLAIVSFRKRINKNIALKAIFEQSIALPAM